MIFGITRLVNFAHFPLLLNMGHSWRKYIGTRNDIQIKSVRFWMIRITQVINKINQRPTGLLVK